MDVNNFTNEDKQILIRSYMFPMPASDMVWLNCLLNLIKEILGRDYFVGLNSSLLSVFWGWSPTTTSSFSWH